MSTIFAREGRAGGRDLGEVVITDAPKSLEHPGPAQQGAEHCGAIPLCESAPGVERRKQSRLSARPRKRCRERSGRHFWRGESERDEHKAQRALPCRRWEFLKSRACPKAWRTHSVGPQLRC